MNDEKLRRILEDKKLRMMLEEASPQQEIERLREVITRAASHWLNLHPGVAWEGDIADAMAAATAEIDTLREAIRRLAEQDATLSVCDGNVTVTMDATLTEVSKRDSFRNLVRTVSRFVAEKLASIVGEKRRETCRRAYDWGDTLHRMCRSRRH